MSVATLGLAVNSEPVVSATKALKDLTAAAKPATAAAADLSKTSAAGTSAVVGHAKAMTTASAAAKGLSWEARNLGFQLVDVTQGLAMGQSAFMIFSQQAGQIGQIIATSPTGLGGLVKELGAGFRALVSPTTLVVGGLAAIGIGAAVAVNSIAQSAKALDDLSRAAGSTNAQMRGLESAAAFKGINITEFSDGMSHFASSVYDAQHGMGGLASVFRANNTSAKSFNDYMEKAANLIAKAGSDQQRLQILQQMGLPATMQWVRFMSQGADGIRAAVAETTKFDEAANDKLIANARKFDEAWAKTWKNFSANGQSAIVTAIDYMGRLFDASDRVAKQVGNSSFWNKFIPANTNPKDFGLEPVTGGDRANGRVRGGFDAMQENPINTSLQRALQDRAKALRGDSTVDPNALQHQIALEQQHISLLGQTATATDAVRSVELQVQQARLAGVSITQKQVDVLKQLASENTLGITQIKSMTDSYNVETATIGMSVGQATAYAAAQNAINDAKRAGRALTQDNIASINAQSQALGDAAAKADLMNMAYNGLVRGPLQTLTSQIANGAKFFDALKSAGISALNAIASKLADMAAQSLWSNAMGGASGGGGLMGFLGKALGIGGGINANGSIAGAIGPTSVGGAPLVFSAMGNVFPANDNGISRYSNSIVTKPTMFAFAKGTGMMGEAGPEAIMPLTRGPNGKLGVAASGSGVGGQNVHVTVGVSVDENGNLQAYVKDVAQSTTAAGVSAAMTGPGFTSRVAKATKQARSLRQIA